MPHGLRWARSHSYLGLAGARVRRSDFAAARGSRSLAAATRSVDSGRRLAGRRHSRIGRIRGSDHAHDRAARDASVDDVRRAQPLRRVSRRAARHADHGDADDERRRLRQRRLRRRRTRHERLGFQRLFLRNHAARRALRTGQRKRALPSALAVRRGDQRRLLERRYDHSARRAAHSGRRESNVAHQFHSQRRGSG